MSAGNVGDAERGRMAMLAGLNYSGSEIADELGYSESTVYKHLNEMESEAKAADDPYDVFTRYYLATVFDQDFLANLSTILDV